MQWIKATYDTKISAGMHFVKVGKYGDKACWTRQRIMEFLSENSEGTLYYLDESHSSILSTDVQERAKEYARVNYAKPPLQGEEEAEYVQAVSENSYLSGFKEGALSTQSTEYADYLKKDASRNEFILTNVPDQFGIKREWLFIWNEIEKWYGDIKKVESGKQFLERMQSLFTISQSTPLAVQGVESNITDILQDFIQNDQRSVGKGCNHEEYILAKDISEIAKRIIAGSSYSRGGEAELKKEAQAELIWAMIQENQDADDGQFTKEDIEFELYDWFKKLEIKAPSPVPLSIVEQLEKANPWKGYYGDRQLEKNYIYGFKTAVTRLRELLTNRTDDGIDEAGLKDLKIALDCFERFMPKDVSLSDYKQMAMYEAYHRIKGVVYNGTESKEVKK